MGHTTNCQESWNLILMNNPPPPKRSKTVFGVNWLGLIMLQKYNPAVNKQSWELVLSSKIIFFFFFFTFHTFKSKTNIESRFLHHQRIISCDKHFDLHLCSSQNWHSTFLVDNHLCFIFVVWVIVSHPLTCSSCQQGGYEVKWCDWYRVRQWLMKDKFPWVVHPVTKEANFAQSL